MLRYFFNEAAWFYSREHQPEDDDPLPHEIEWAAGSNNEHKIAYVNDHQLGIEFFAFDSTVEGKIDVIEKKLLDGPFDVLSKEGLLQRFRDCGADDRLHNFKLLMAVFFDGESEELVGIVKDMLASSESDERSEAVAAMSYLVWPSVPSLISDVLKDPDESVRRRASLVLEGFDKFAK
jgi:hypothetical protein